MDYGIVEMVPVHCCSHKGLFVLLCATVLEAGASVVPYLTVIWVVCAIL